MRFLLSRTDALGDLIISLPIQERILSRQPEAEIHWLVPPYTAPVLQGMPGVQEVHHRGSDEELDELMVRTKPDAVLNLGHRDKAVITAAKKAGVPIRVARSRGSQIWQASHVLWGSRYGTGRHESQNVLEFLKPWHWQGGVPRCPRLSVSIEERDQGRQELPDPSDPRPVLGLILRGSGAGAFPSQIWWDRAVAILEDAGWRGVILSPPGSGTLPPTDLRGLMGRMAACDVILGPSTGPVQLASVLGLPVLCLMGLRPNHSPDRWAPLGDHVQILCYPGPEEDLAGGMDRLDPHSLLMHLDRLRSESGDGRSRR
jgi:heptosyltransferase III